MEKEWMSDYGLKSLIEKSYNIKITKIEKMHKVLRLYTNEGIKALKKVYSPYREYIYVLEVMDHARRNGFSNIPLVSSTKDGKKGIEDVKGVFTLMEWIDSRLMDYDNTSDCILMGQALAKLHNASEGYEPSTKASPRIMWGKWIDIFKFRCSEIKRFNTVAKNKLSKTEFDKIFLKHVDYFYDIAKKAVNDLESSNYKKISMEYQKKNTFAHYDAAQHNTLLTPDNKVFFIDFDNSVLDMTLIDLSDLIIKSVRYGNWDRMSPKIIFDSYNEVKPVLQEETEIMKAFWKFPYELWRLAHRCYNEDRDWSQKHINISLKRIIGDIGHREEFIENFNAY